MPAQTAIEALVSRLLARCLDIREVWSIGHVEPDAAAAARSHELLVFADPLTLQQLRKCEDLQRSDVELLVVVDGDLFESVWGTRKLSGSLARWAWRQTAPGQAYYDESRWGDGGAVVRVRRKAILMWRSAEVAATT